MKKLERLVLTNIKKNSVKKSEEDEDISDYGISPDDFALSPKDKGILTEIMLIGALWFVQFYNKRNPTTFQITPEIEGQLKNILPKKDVEAYLKNREQYLKDTVYKNYAKKITQVVQDGIKNGTPYTEVASKIQRMFTADGTTIEGWKALQIAQTESQYARSQGEYLKMLELGIQLADILPANNACRLCLDAAADGPYNIEKVASLLPLHPHCRCDWVEH